MRLSLRAHFWRFVLRKLFKTRQLTIEQHRAQGARMAAALRLPPAVKLDRCTLGRLPVAWIRPESSSRQKAMLYLHGGGYVTGGIDSHLVLCVPLAQTLRMNLLLPEYRLAPEHPFPAALEDALLAYGWLLEQGHAPENILIAGDSAGGGLSLATVLALRERGHPLPAAVICLSPWADLTHGGPSHRSKARAEVVLKTHTLQEWALAYTRPENLSNPLVSPVYADFHGFPPLLIQVGSEEILLDDALTLAEKARAAGVEVTLQVWEGLWHVWPALGDLLPESGQAFDAMGRFIDSL
jgi:acetyl esterase/lipase